MEMEEAREGVDYAEGGADVGWKLRLALFAAVGVPVLMAGYLIIASAARAAC